MEPRIRSIGTTALVLGILAFPHNGGLRGQATPQKFSFSDGFETGNHSAWTNTSLTTAGICSFDAPTISSERFHSGKFAARGTFVLEPSNSGPKCNGVVANVHQDKNIYDVKATENGLSKFRVGAWFYLEKEQARIGHAQKLFYLLAKGGAPRIVLTTQPDQVDHRPSVYFSYNTGQGGSHSLFGIDSEVKTHDPSSANGILNLPYDEWFYLEMEIGYRSSGKASDSSLRLYYATDKQSRKEVFRKTKNWSSVRCNSQGSQSCPPFPDDDFLPLGITEFRVGAQVDRQNDVPVHEIRYWDDVIIEALD